MDISRCATDAFAAIALQRSESKTIDEHPADVFDPYAGANSQTSQFDYEARDGSTTADYTGGPLPNQRQTIQ
jgi:hypothetical protein